MQPIADNVLVQALETETVSAGGIIIPEVAKKKSGRCTVIAVGPGRHLESGERAPMSVKPGDKVIIAPWSCVEVKVDGEIMMIAKDREILAVVDD